MRLGRGLRDGIERRRGSKDADYTRIVLGGVCVTQADGTIAIDVQIDTSAAREQLQSISELATSAADSALQGISEVAGRINEQLVSDLEKAFERYAEIAVNAASAQEFEEAGRLIVGEISRGISDSGEAVDAVRGMVAETRGASDAAVASADFPGVGRSIPEGMALGVASGTGLLVSAVQGMVQQALAAARAAADSHSPSRKAAEIGRDFGDGFAVGVAERTRESAAMVAGFVDAMLGTAQRQIDRAGTGAGGRAVSGGGDGGVVINVGGVTVAAERIADAYDAERLADDVGRLIGQKAARQARLRGVVGRR